ncbi:MAG: 16S rRNA (guanine(966)-N(2))-methyltransferase RsmD [Dehalococcoidia bacterium]|nr:MAG: 16S rRNA (guanine(966)-N(2))-methyltransferase RsmD [Dehalococcoidia bacterium]
MRVIAGKAKGCILKSPKGNKTRPATELVRGAIFSILESMAEDWSKLLDLFSGSGSLGIEALSRGVDWVDFVEQEPRCCAIIKQNLKKTGFKDSAHVYCCSVNRALSFLDKEYGIIIMDPPYSSPSIDRTLEQLANSELVSDKSIVVVTHSQRRPLKSGYASLNLMKEHRHGDSVIALYRKEG